MTRGITISRDQEQKHTTNKQTINSFVAWMKYKSKRSFLPLEVHKYGILGKRNTLQKKKTTAEFPNQILKMEKMGHKSSIYLLLNFILNHLYQSMFSISSFLGRLSCE